jgi:peptidylprolyl isomerase
MPHKLKSTARKSRRNKKIGIVAGVTLLAVLVVAAVYYFSQPVPARIPVVQGKVLLQTSMGNITIQLRDDKPITSGNFKMLAQEGIYDDTIFHRVIAGFMIQGGDPTGTGQGDPSIGTILDEIGSNNSNVRGTIAMANTGQPNSASSQFFINVVDNGDNVIDSAGTKFDSVYTVFGTVTQGMDVVDAISNVAVGPNQVNENSKPLTDVTLIKAEILP